MTWNWESKKWPKFTYNLESIESKLNDFYFHSGKLLGVSQSISMDSNQNLRLEIITDEALKTSEIEGEYFNRESVQSSIQKQFGLKATSRRPSAAEYGIAEMMVDLYQSSQVPLTHEKLFSWHRMLTNGRRDLDDIGRYRTSPESMQVVSGPLGKERVHFEGPPSDRVYLEMERFLEWYNTESRKLHPVVQAGIAHLYFVCIHPFEDGNGRIGRAIAEKILSERLGQPSLIALSYTVEKYKRQYYEALERNNKSMEITDWLEYFSETILLAIQRSLNLASFILAKTRFYDKFQQVMNERQKKVCERIFKEGPDGFQGGLSLSNYLSITKTSRATATRDLIALVDLGAFRKTGELKGTRYFLNLEGLIAKE